MKHYFDEKKRLGENAYKFCANYANLEYFNHALEYLLHIVLEEEMDSKPQSKTDSMLSRTSEFVKRFTKSLEIIVNCARKSEMAMWEYFFSVIGDPKEMFHECLNEGLLSTATSYLIVIQTLDTPAVSGELAIKLLKKAFEMKDYSTGSELVRFLRTIDESETHPKPIKTNGDETKEGGVERSPDLFFFEILINDHAKKVLVEQQFRDLHRYTVLFQIPLHDWLKRER